MSKIRVYELAREYKLESKLLMNRLKDMGIVVASHQSTLTNEQIARVKKALSPAGGGDGAAEAAQRGPTIIRRRRPASEGAPVAEEKPDVEEVAAKDAEATPAASPKPATIIKRREAVAFAEDDAQKEASSEAASRKASLEEREELAESERSLEKVAEKPVEVEKTEQAANEPIVEGGEEQRQLESRAEEAVAGDTAQHETAADRKIEKVQPESVGADEEKKASAAEDIQKAKESTEEMKSGSAPAPVSRERERKFERPASQGATIVRRASPEEVQARKTATPNLRHQPRGRYTPNVPAQPRNDEQRDDRGQSQPRQQQGFSQQQPYSGTADRPSYPKKPAGPVVASISVDVAVERGGSGKEGGHRLRGHVERKKHEEHDLAKEEEIRRVATAKAKRDSFNIRDVLGRLGESEEEDLLDEVSSRRKTVYTPSASGKKRDLKRRKDLKKTQVTVPRAAYRVIKMGSHIQVGELGKQLGVKAVDLMKKLMSQGIMASINQEIDQDVAALIAAEYGFEVQNNQVTEEGMVEKCCGVVPLTDEIIERPPIVTIMGHVDHGKTSILDAIRQANVAAGEAGGITQHIGAYTVTAHGKAVAFLDTPGHEAFSAMRARGAQVTDIIVLVVAADDGVMPQTVEAITHAREAEVPIIVCINKIDKPNVNYDRIYSELMEYAIQSEEWGGEHQFVKVSALEKRGIDDLLDAILLQAEVLELKASPAVRASGVVVEANLDRGRGPVATVMVQNGTLRVGDILVTGTTFGKVRAMQDHIGRIIQEAGPSTPVEVIGLAEVPKAGDQADVALDDKLAKELVEWRINEEQKKQKVKSSAATLEKLLSKVKAQETPEVPVIVKADTQGSVEALCESIIGIKSDKVRNRIVSKGVGGVSESDISLAATSQAIIVAFNVRAGRGLDEVAEQKGVPIKYFSIIYDVVDALKAVMAGSLPPIRTEVIQGHAEVRATIKVPKVGVVAGTAVIDGKITRNSFLRLIRDDVVIYSGKLGSLKRFKDDVREVAQGYECGIAIEGYNDIKEGDIIESYVMHEETASI
jgi:translation initiation factor IF-2